jgi:hypothetical protein
MLVNAKQLVDLGVHTHKLLVLLDEALTMRTLGGKGMSPWSWRGWTSNFLESEGSIHMVISKWTTKW